MKFLSITIAMLLSADIVSGQNKRIEAKQAVSEMTHSFSEQLPFADARNMTLMIFLADPPRAPGTLPVARGEAVGSGVWIGKAGYVVTCYHVVNDWHGPFKIGFARNAFVNEGGGVTLHMGAALNIWTADLVASDPDADIAILKAAVTPDQAQPNNLVSGSPLGGSQVTPQVPLTPKGSVLRAEFPKLGESLLLAGYPLAGYPVENRTLILQTGAATGLDFPPTGDFVRRGERGLRIFLSLVSNPGNSGGPVFDAEGHVVGLLEGNLPSPIRDERGVALKYKRQRLDQNGNPLFDNNNQPVLEDAIFWQNSGISLAVPARLIARLAEQQHISLE